MNYQCPMCGRSTNTAGNCMNCASPVVYTSTTVNFTDYCAKHDTHHIGGCFQCSQESKEQRIAELEAENAHKDRVIEALAEDIVPMELWYCDNEMHPVRFKTKAQAIKWAEAKAKEAE